MKKSLLEKSFVIVLFILVMVAFSFAERDTQKAFQKYNVKSTVETLTQKVDYTAEASEKSSANTKATRN
jgi:hypothetical protein